MPHHEFNYLLIWVVQPNEYQRSIERYQSTIRCITDRLIQEKKRKIENAAANNKTYEENDFLSRLRELNFTSLCFQAEYRFSEVQCCKTLGS